MSYKELNRDFSKAPKDGSEFYAIVPMCWCTRRECFTDREGDPWDLDGTEDVLCTQGGELDMFLGWVQKPREPAKTADSDD